jgi:sec-independent protein translocase protein TatA
MTFLASLMNFGGPDLIVILLIVLVLFGAKRLPDLARGMGQAMKEFQKAKDDLSHELRTPANVHTQADNSRSGSDVPH